MPNLGLKVRLYHKTVQMPLDSFNPKEFLLHHAWAAFAIPR